MDFPQTWVSKLNVMPNSTGNCITNHPARSPAANSDDSLSGNLEVTYLSC